MDRADSRNLVEEVSTHIGYISAATGVIALAAAVAKMKAALVPSVPLVAEIVSLIAVLAALIWIGYIGLEALQRSLIDDRTSWLSASVIALSVPVTLLMGKAAFFVALGL